MVHLDLYRRWYEPDRTIGELYEHGGEFIAFTMEPGWNDKEFPHIDAGEYQLEPHSGPAFKDTWALVGPGVSHYKTPGVLRSAILLHAGNLDEETKGCILVGLGIGRLKGETAVISSQSAMSVLRKVIGKEPASLTIWDD